MTLNIGTEMVRKRVIELDEERDSRIDEWRGNRKDKLLAESAANPKPRPTRLASWWRGRKTITIA